MTTYAHHHGVHFGRPRLNLALFAAVLAAIIGVGAWVLVDHYTGSRTGNQPTVSANLSYAQTVTSIEVIRWGQMSADERPYAVRMYRSAPYQLQGMKLFYAAGAVSTHFQANAVQEATLRAGRATLMARFMTSPEAHPVWLSPYGIDSGQAATAITRGMYDGALPRYSWR